MKMLDDAAVEAALPWTDLIAAIESILTEAGADAPPRTVHAVPDGVGGEAYFLMKPGWVARDIIAVKAVTFFPNNGAAGIPTVNAGVLLFDGSDGRFIGACDGGVLTARRTAAASAVAAKRLARRDARRLLVIGTGTVAPCAAGAHAAVRDYDTIEIWGRDPDKAAVAVATAASGGITATVCTDLDRAIARADVISSATGATEPVIAGALIGPGTHVDLIGSFQMDMREADDDLVRRATLFVDTRDDAILAGDLGQPLASGVITLDDIQADLTDLVAGRHPGRTTEDEITYFKSAGFALEDVAAARLAFGR